MKYIHNPNKQFHTFVTKFLYAYRMHIISLLVILVSILVMQKMTDETLAQDPPPEISYQVSTFSCPIDKNNGSTVKAYCGYIEKHHTTYYQRYGCPCENFTDYSAEQQSSDFVHYCQCDPSLDKSKGENFCNNACGLFSLATIMTKLGRRVLPQEVRDNIGDCWAPGPGLYNASTCEGIKTMLDKYGFEMKGDLLSGGGVDQSRAKDAFRDNQLILCSNSSAYHIVVVSGITDDGRLIVHNSSNISSKGCVNGVNPQVTTLSSNWCNKYAIAIGKKGSGRF